jgi:hypothetical protein
MSAPSPCLLATIIAANSSSALLLSRAVRGGSCPAEADADAGRPGLLIEVWRASTPPTGAAVLVRRAAAARTAASPPPITEARDGESVGETPLASSIWLKSSAPLTNGDACDEGGGSSESRIPARFAAPRLGQPEAGHLCLGDAPPPLPTLKTSR